MKLVFKRVLENLLQI